MERRLAAILSADAVGYTRLMAEDEDSAVRAISEARELIGERVASHHGRVVDAPGDNVMAELPSALDAVLCAVEAQHAFAERGGTDAPLRFRIGIHLGDIRAEAGRIYGDGINIASRLEGLAEPGGICISGTVHDQVRRRLDLAYEDLGEREIKNVPEPVHAFRIQLGSEAAPAPRRARGLPRGALPVAVFAVLALALVLGRDWLPGMPGEAEASGIHSLAVLPLANLSEDPGQGYFADGMTEALIADLAKIGSLRVISRTSAMRYRDSEKSIPEIAAELGVDAVIEGSVLRAGDAVRITAQLIDARSDAHLWAESYERDLSDVLALQRELARTIAGEVQANLTPLQRARLEQAPRVDPAAYDAYLRGNHFFNLSTPESFRRAEEHFQEAIRIDPSYAAAYARLADTYS